MRLEITYRLIDFLHGQLIIGLVRAAPQGVFQPRPALCPTCRLVHGAAHLCADGIPGDLEFLMEVGKPLGRFVVLR